MKTGDERQETAANCTGNAQSQYTRIVQADSEIDGDRIVAPIPTTPDAIRQFIGSSFMSRKNANENGIPSEDDTYCVSAHDLLEAFRDWADIFGRPAEDSARYRFLRDLDWLESRTLRRLPHIHNHMWDEVIDEARREWK